MTYYVTGIENLYSFSLQLKHNRMIMQITYLFIYSFFIGAEVSKRWCQILVSRTDYEGNFYCEKSYVMQFGVMVLIMLER